MKIFAALPIMNEPHVEQTIRQILGQVFFGDVACREVVCRVPTMELYICVNQPESFKTDPENRHIYEQNQRTLEYFCGDAACHVPTRNVPTIKIIDKSTNGWESKNHGVGWARKVLMDTINEVANPDDIIISLDADTEYPPTYFQSVKDIFEKNPKAVALSNPYYHKLIGRESEDRAILRYEIYMRCYLLNLFRISSPYAFTALGSAMAVRVKDYRKIGGMAPKKSGEDFYFLQQLCKIGQVFNHNEIVVYPLTRLSNRVFFGTGPALIKGISGDWTSYPIYSPKLWNQVANIYQNFESYFSKEDLQKFRTNSKTEHQFQKFCYEKFDALRVLQHLKSEHQKTNQPDEVSLLETINLFEELNLIPQIQFLERDFSFENSSIEDLNNLRNLLFEAELKLRKQSDSLL